MYRVTVDEPVRGQIEALPPTGLAAWRGLRAMLEVAPGSGRPLFADAPDGVQTFAFGERGEGLACYLVIEHDRQVAVIDVQWFD